MTNAKADLLKAIDQLEQNECGEVTFKLLEAITLSTMLDEESYEDFKHLGFKTSLKLYHHSNMNCMGTLEQIQADPNNPRNWEGFENYHPDDDGIELCDAIDVLVKGVQEYECDFWSSPDAGVTLGEARKAAAVLINSFLFDKEGLPQKVDGGMIESIIQQLRVQNEKG
jgi:hypothetical protein